MADFNAEPIRLIEAQFQRVVVGPDDVIIVTCEQLLNDRQRERMLEQLKRVFPSPRVCLVMDGGCMIGAMGPPCAS